MFVFELFLLVCVLVYLGVSAYESVCLCVFM